MRIGSGRNCRDGTAFDLVRMKRWFLAFLSPKKGIVTYTIRNGMLWYAPGIFLTDYIARTLGGEDIATRHLVYMTAGSLIAGILFGIFGYILSGAVSRRDHSDNT